LTLGAFDCVPKPDSNRDISTLPNFREEIIRKIKVLAAGHPRAKAPREVVARPIAPVQTRGYSLVPPRVVVIGSSTGGPPALTVVLEALSPSLDSIPVLIAQHMLAMFTAVLAERLARATGRETKEGADGELLQPGTVYVAPGNHHMTVSRGAPPRLSVKKGPPVHFCRPAIDPLFATAAAVFGPATLAIVLTGMGQDGAAGALAVANAGGSVIAQDEASSVVWGMPGATAAAGACAALLPPLKIAQVTAKLIAGERA
jgi:two-component system chemotaxis response regulator CheB